MNNILHETAKRAKKSGFINFDMAEDGFRCVKRGMIVIASIAVELDKKSWLHVSMSFANRIPTYQEMKFVKNIFVGEDKKAIQIFPPESEHVNINSCCLHLWHCLNDDTLPDFTKGTGLI